MVSIVMAAYNEERYIRESISSVLAQTYPHFEFIIINDGSTDNTEAIILSYDDPRIRYIKNEQNLKLIDSLNKGLHAAQGTYIARMDADDICMPNRLEQQVQFMEANPSVGISGTQLKIFGAAEGMMAYPLMHEDIRLRLFITSCFGNNVVIFRKDLMHQYQLFFQKGYLHAEDYKCWTEWIAHTKAANLPECLVQYRAHDSSVSVKHSDIQKTTRNRIRQEYVASVFQLEKEPEIAADFTGALSATRIRATRHIIRLNKAQKLFDHHRLVATVTDLWYLDALEGVEKNFLVFFKYPLIFNLALRRGLSSWANLLKHYLKFKLSTH